MADQPQSRVTSRDIAREAGVSQPTVSRALRGDPRVAPGTVARIRAAARRLGYEPHAGARALITRRSGTIALVAADLNNPFYPELVEALKAELEAHGYRAILCGGPPGTEGEESVGRLVRSKMVDGAIVATARDDRETQALLAEESAALVLVVREVEGTSRDAVVADNEGGAAAAADLIADLGHRRIGMISGPADTSTARQRDRGFRAGLAARGLSIEPALQRAGEFSYETGRKACAELLDQPAPPTALFCGNDVIALGALDGARAEGIDVPGRLSIVGFDDIDLAGWESFLLTTVRQPLVEMAREAVRLLVDRVDGNQDPARRRIFPTELIVRGTAAMPPQM